MKKIAALLTLTLCSLVLAQTQFGDWRYVENIDLITDENTSFIMTLTTEYPDYARSSGMAIRCSSWGSYGIEVFFNADRYLGSQSTKAVTFRFDSEEAVTQTWDVSTDGEAMFAPDRVVPEFLSALNHANQFIFRVSSPSTSLTYVAPVDGLNDALYRLGCYRGTL